MEHKKSVIQCQVDSDLLQRAKALKDKGIIRKGVLTYFSGVFKKSKQQVYQVFHTERQPGLRKKISEHIELLENRERKVA